MIKVCLFLNSVGSLQRYISVITLHVLLPNWYRWIFRILSRIFYFGSIYKGTCCSTDLGKPSFTPHAQRERGKVIGVGVLLYIYMIMFVDPKNI